MNENKKLTFWEHLEELRWAIVRILVAIFIASIISFIYVNDLLRLILLPLDNIMETQKVILNQSGPFDAFFIKFKMGIMSALLICIPYIIYEAWNFILPALKPKEERMFISFILFGSVLFLCGLTLAFLSLKIIMQTMLSFSIEGIQNIWRLEDYISFVFQWLLLFGLVFELPLVLVLLIKTKLVKIESLKKTRPAAVIAAFVLGAIITPPDAISQILVAIPLIILYEIGIFLAGIQKIT